MAILNLRVSHFCTIHFLNKRSILENRYWRRKTSSNQITKFRLFFSTITTKYRHDVEFPKKKPTIRAWIETYARNSTTKYANPTPFRPYGRLIKFKKRTQRNLRSVSRFIRTTLFTFIVVNYNYVERDRPKKSIFCLNAVRINITLLMQLRYFTQSISTKHQFFRTLYFTRNCTDLCDRLILFSARKKPKKLTNTGHQRGSYIFGYLYIRPRVINNYWRRSFGTARRTYLFIEIIFARVIASGTFCVFLENVFLLMPEIGAI